MSNPKQKWWIPLVNVIVDAVGEQLKAQNARISALEGRMDQFGYKGVWESGRVYLKHNSVSEGGSLWICVNEQSTRRPGDSPDWKLAVKRGKDGKDARQ